MADRPCTNPLMEEIDEDNRKHGDLPITEKEMEEIHKRHYGEKGFPEFNIETLLE